MREYAATEDKGAKHARMLGKLSNNELLDKLSNEELIGKRSAKGLLDKLSGKEARG